MESDCLDSAGYLNNDNAISVHGILSEKDSPDIHHGLYIIGPKGKVVELLNGMLAAAQAVEVSE